ncbi:MAG: hypothetical protein JST53_03350 [Actinobacteria bacterium]|nr:hypothetical protein [Actinomycetota bacterium]
MPPELLDRLRDLLVGLLRDLLVEPLLPLAAGLLVDLLEPLLLFAAGRAFVELALVDFDLRAELDRAELERFFV